MKWIWCLVLTYKLTLTLIMELEENERETRGGEEIGYSMSNSETTCKGKAEKTLFSLSFVLVRNRAGVVRRRVRYNWLFLFISLSTITRTLYAFVPLVLL